MHIHQMSLSLISDETHQTHVGFPGNMFMFHSVSSLGQSRYITAILGKDFSSYLLGCVWGVPSFLTPFPNVLCLLTTLTVRHHVRYTLLLVGHCNIATYILLEDTQRFVANRDTLQRESKHTRNLTFCHLRGLP